MVKRYIAAAAAATALSATVAAPASAAEVHIAGDKCTLSYDAKEAGLIKELQETATSDDRKETVADIVNPDLELSKIDAEKEFLAKQREAVKAQIAVLNEELAKEDNDEESRVYAQELLKIYKPLDAFITIKDDAVRKCTAVQASPADPASPAPKPADPASPAPKPADPASPAPSPADPAEPTPGHKPSATGSDLSSADGKPNATGIALIAGGAVTAVLALLAAGLHFLAPMLPPQAKAVVPAFFLK
ncbi:hypothetical protein CPHO_08945 [Corynebacterium phocae]|uniref:Uncharacterized protein n=1 Tax=Corynebacterium phocae TaxID=161895 RepID=A0A1L7D4C8_9CORY|nr:hypothetical protein [Corynebacterium phocae]APT92994.1 hypothetical protein CPHO_08945 [Corynebacterium phocae]KAA8723333.1 hypothetical protein F4V58_08450 [Corynebacterium phocae]